MIRLGVAAATRLSLAAGAFLQPAPAWQKTVKNGGITTVRWPATGEKKPVKIGYISTFSGPTAVIGNDMRNAFELALDHLGRKIGGLPVEVIYDDDQQGADAGKQK